MDKVSPPLYVPFQAIEGRINAETIHTLIHVYKVRPELARSLDGHEIREPADLLRIREFTASADIAELWRFLTRTGAPPSEKRSITEVEQFSEKYSRTVFGRRAYDDGSNEYSIADARGDLISCGWLMQEGRPDFASLKLGGYYTWELPGLGNDTIARLHERLIARPAVLAGLVWYEHLAHHLPERNRRSFALVSQLLRSLQGFIAPRVDDAAVGAATLGGAPGTSVTGGVVAGGGAVTGGGVVGGGSAVPANGTQGPCPWDPAFENGVNGCTCVPDFNFKDCCDAHDRCYEAGGCDSCDRLDCDIALYQCILQRTGNPNLAWAYYVGVRTFSDSFFNYCDGHRRAPLYVSIGGLIGAGFGLAVAQIVPGSDPFTLTVTGLLIGGTAGAKLGQLAEQAEDSALCRLCDWGTQLWQECVERIERLRRERKKRYEKRKKECKKKKHWWQRLWCRFKNAVEYGLEVFWDELTTLVCKATAGALRLWC